MVLYVGVRAAEPVVHGVFAGVQTVPDCGGNCRPAGGYSDYTWFHLPGKNREPAPPKAVEAMPAILAARIAFSSLTIRFSFK